MCVNNEPEQMPAGSFTENETGTFERELATVLRPVKLPEGFAGRVLAQVSQEHGRESSVRGKVIPFRAWRLVGGAAIAAALIGGVFATEDVRQHREREHRQAIANQQFETASRITDQVLAHTREELERSGALRGD